MMKHRIKDWFYWNGFFIWGVIAVMAIIALFCGVLVAKGNTYKFNCKLNHRPDLYTTFFIAGDTYAYDPEYFCNQLKQEMNKGAGN